ncbi:MAG: ATP-dependent helicase [Anaeromicrobium sp.]|uniref:ATP-dependent helicase n=1 Tax=Anaeromicrobium sp. TaxID=1929132 RepID=UPI0025D7354B|nr:ATP-dependent helicase [Anaeromicrobium sp.]MCT4595814.1 ATP-dependent helicase [Anaeromicrobium sp.]
MDFSFFKDLDINLSETQKKIVKHKNGPALVLAVPGAGKTTTLICRTAYLLLKHKIKAENILSITFSRASAKDMKARFYSIFKDKFSDKIYFATIHQLCLKIINRYYYRKNISFKILDSKDTISKNHLIRKIYYDINHKGPSEDTLEQISNSISLVKNLMIPKEQFSFHDFSVEHFSSIYEKYEEYKKQNRIIDFDDMLTVAYKILKSDENLLSQYRNQYKYIQVDEAQDTSKIQHEIIKLLSSPNNNLFMVADDDQSIYGFRGACPLELLDFSNTYKDSQIYFLEENYRSSKEIVNISNEFIKSNSSRYNKNIFTQNEEFLPVNIIKVHDSLDQINFIIEHLNSSKEKTAILYRNNISALPLIDKLNKNSIDFFIHGFKSNYLTHWITKDILAFLDLSLNHYDLESFERIYYKMNGYISKASVSYIKNNPKSITVFDYLIGFPGLKSYQIKNLNRIKDSFNALCKMTPYESLEFIENDLAYHNYLESNCTRLKSSYENAVLLFSHLKLLAIDEPNIVSFMERLSEIPKIASKSKENKNIVLSTVHSAKGLEYNRVFIIDLIKGQFPSMSNLDEEDEDNISYLEEERRLFYVAMTRAKENLSIVCPTFQNGRYIKPSIFIDEVNGTKLKDYINRTNWSPKTTIQKHDEDTSKNHPYEEGEVINHTKFGIGIILHINGDLMKIDFNSIGTRILSIDMCMEQDLID